MEKNEKLYRVQVRHYIPFSFSEDAYTDSQVVFNSKTAMDNYVNNFERDDFTEIAQTEVCYFNEKGILSRKKVLKNLLIDEEYD